MCVGGANLRLPCRFGQLSVQKNVVKPFGACAIDVAKDAISTHKAWLLLGWLYEDDELPREERGRGRNNGLFLLVDGMSTQTEKEEHLRRSTVNTNTCSTRW